MAAIKDTGYNLINEIPFASNLSGLLGVGDRTMPMPNIYGSGKDIVKAITVPSARQLMRSQSNTG